MPKHIRISSAEICVLVHLIPRHFIHHGAFQMHHFIMGQGQNILFMFIIAHGKSQSVMISFAINRVKLHIFTEVVHPAHIPFESETQSVPAYLAAHMGPCSGFFRHSYKIRICSSHNGIQMFKKLNGIQILFPAVFIRYPLPILSSVIQIQH